MVKCITYLKPAPAMVMTCPPCVLPAAGVTVLTSILLVSRPSPLTAFPFPPPMFTVRLYLPAGSAGKEKLSEVSDTELTTAS